MECPLVPRVRSRASPAVPTAASLVAPAGEVGSFGWLSSEQNPRITHGSIK